MSDNTKGYIALALILAAFFAVGTLEYNDEVLKQQIEQGE